MIVSSGETKIFEKKLKKGVTKQGGILIVSGVGVMFFQIFSENNSATGADFGNNPGRGGVQHASLVLTFEAKMAQKQLKVGDMLGKEIKIFNFFEHCVTFRG